MPAYSYKLLALVSFLILAPSLFAQKPSVDYTALTIKQIVTDLEALNLLPTPSEVTIVGQVVVFQRIRIKKQIDLMEAIAISGGLTQKAGQIIRIIRKNANGIYDQEHLVSIRAIQTGRQEPIELQPGDIIIAPKNKNGLNFFELISR